MIGGESIFLEFEIISNNLFSSTQNNKEFVFAYLIDLISNGFSHFKDMILLLCFAWSIWAYWQLGPNLSSNKKNHTMVLRRDSLFHGFPGKCEVFLLIKSSLIGQNPIISWKNYNIPTFRSEIQTSKPAWIWSINKNNIFLEVFDAIHRIVQD